MERIEEKKISQLWRVSLTNGRKKKVLTSHDYWEYFVAYEGEFLYSKKYEDKSDHTRSQLFRFHLKSKVKEEVADFPSGQPEDMLEPMLYELDSDYHKTIAEFLSLKLPLACEYLEKEGYIIISYYLRLEEGFDRYLLAIKDGKKRWKIRQDAGMKGFSSGSFFVMKNQLVFVKNSTIEYKNKSHSCS